MVRIKVEYKVIPTVVGLMEDWVYKDFKRGSTKQGQRDRNHTGLWKTYMFVGINIYKNSRQDVFGSKVMLYKDGVIEGEFLTFGTLGSTLKDSYSYEPVLNNEPYSLY